MMMLLFMNWLAVADYAFLIFHTALILFNLLGWISSFTRKWHLYTISLTLASWFFLGIWYGWGYCPFTDWHWEILRLRGVGDLPNSYINYLFNRLLGLQPPPKLIEVSTLLFTLMALLLSLWVNFRKRSKGEKKEF
ncbi:DUF2784 domain-containing protein [Cyclobacterium jeungdonense]|uniref:DUF2784 domain-containing protein n=1 Tax=Cyclobacterium jeungdonense TaxID=708087 RepID=A0ABT8CC29_9BACT|nr:DUF2784 domain-containing protein [Cyclobacterium jeungdonense]MDN3689310.1 DUF2784 domain-containing protein [Cyclobacterium jeungdonense]